MPRGGLQLQAADNIICLLCCYKASNKTGFKLHTRVKPGVNNPKMYFVGYK